jgi:hypothetical protein
VIFYMNNDTMKMYRKVLNVQSELTFTDGEKMRSCPYERLLAHVLFFYVVT